MQGDPEFVILKHTAWLPAPQYKGKILGSIIRYPLKPSDDYEPPSPLKYNKAPYHDGTLENFLLTNTANQSHDVSLTLQSLAGFSFKGNTEDAVHLSGKLVRYRRLTQHSKFWAELKADPTIAQTVPGWISLFNTWPPCLVVGIMTATAVELDLSGSKSRECNGKLELPLATIALTAEVAPKMGDLKLEAGSTSKVARAFTAAVPDERIFALELRIVTTAALRWRELKLKEGGPKVEPGRLQEDKDESSSDEDEPPAVEDLVLEKFTEKEYRQMVG
ncbi:hypothetical protein BHE90_004070 [Fusarium euwallaceae]|uniref:Uncharacterized protein n=1 Tax=Fusarium euwallaceae TaxID=1147111 RepID=A0A430M083_9HYPO|nr:hypothetical protein BHE90_004070 [Fusarium euwallaceae]